MKRLLLLIFMLAVGFHAQAQLKVTSDEDIGIGTTFTEGARVKIQNTERYTGLRLFSDNPSGLSSNMYGIFNEVSHSSSIGSPAYGMYNEIVHPGSGSGYGIFNNLPTTGAGGGYKTGLFNKVYQVSGSSLRSLGVYNELWPYGTGEATGIFNLVKETGSGERSGLKNFIYMPTGEAGTLRGVYNRVYPKGTGFAYGMHSEIENTGTGQRKGVYNRVYQGSSNTSGAWGVESWMFSYGSGSAYGIYSRMNTNSGTTGNQYGVYSYVDNQGTGTSYGVYSKVIGGGNFAGFFDGNVYVNGTVTETSDERLKDNIQDLDRGMTVVQSLRPRQYKRRPKPGQPGRGPTSYGFVAQELETILPGIVTEVVAPGEQVLRYRTETRKEVIIELDDEGNAVERVEEIEEQIPYEEHMPDERYKAVSYNKLIPFLVKAIQEQQATIEELEKRIEALERK